MAIKKFATFMQEDKAPAKRGRPASSNQADLIAKMHAEIKAVGKNREKMIEILATYRKMNLQKVSDAVREYQKKHDIGRLGKIGAPKKDKDSDADDDRNEGKQPVFAFCVLQDTGSNRFFLNKAKTKFIKYDAKDVWAVQLGSAKELEGKNKGEIKSLCKAHFQKLVDRNGEIAGEDAYEKDIEIVDQFALQGAPAAMYGSDESMDDGF